ncbi:hypothetical protein [Pseudomonas yamanorum]|uniref:Lipoprotein n=1 Tax=Pseudomonas yamanorum TaxID=515393 RepID=A0A7Y8EE23_9PSED|nr:hypothetical protein [Pseudomonas yamanorum]NWE12951.1 hypothetical protein [Pseudomonas yamanorum]
MPFFTRRLPGAIAVAALFVSVLAGCAAKSNYVDATEPDAAKLRFVSNSSNAKLYYLDDQHCAGREAGALNNLYVPDTPRRAGMIVPPPAKARGFLEIKVKPGTEGYVFVSTDGYSWMCGFQIGLTPEANAEYEVTLNVRGNKCGVELSRLGRVDGKDVRVPMPAVQNGTPACLGMKPAGSVAK